MASLVETPEEGSAPNEVAEVPSEAAALTTHMDVSGAITESKPQRMLYVSEILETSVKLTWDPQISFFSIDGYRIAQSAQSALNEDEDLPWEIAVKSTQSGHPEKNIVNLEPNTTYRFQVAALHNHKNGEMLVSGSTLISERITTKPQQYMKAWFFERAEEISNEWRMFFGNPMVDGPGGLDPKKMRDVDYRFLGMFAVEPSEEQCYTGVSSMRCLMPGEMAGGVYSDLSVKDSRTYKIIARVYHTNPPGEGGAELRVWDHGDTWVCSGAARRTAGWETLQVSIVGTRKYRIRIHIQCLASYEGFVHVDAVEVHFAGRDRLGRLADELEAATLAQRVNAGGQAYVSVHRAINLPQSSYGRYRAEPSVVLRWGDENEMISRTPAFPKEKENPTADPTRPSWVATGAANVHTLDMLRSPSLTLKIDVQDMAHRARSAQSMIGHGASGSNGDASPGSASVRRRSILALGMSPTSMRGDRSPSPERQVVITEESEDGAVGAPPDPEHETGAEAVTEAEAESETEAKTMDAGDAKPDEKERTVERKAEKKAEKKGKKGGKSAAEEKAGASELVEHPGSDDAGSPTTPSALQAVQGQAAPSPTSSSVGGSPSPLRRFSRSRQKKAGANGAESPNSESEASGSEGGGSASPSRSVTRSFIGRTRRASTMASGGTAVVARGSTAAAAKEGLLVGTVVLNEADLRRLPAHRVFYKLETIDGPIPSAVAVHIRAYDPDMMAGKIGKLCHDAIFASLDEQSAIFDELSRMLGRKKDPFEVLEYKKTMVEQSVPEEAIAALLHAQTAAAASKLLVALLTFPPELIESNDICQARKALQLHLRKLGVLSAVEEAADCAEKVILISAINVTAVAFGSGRRALIAALRPHPVLFALLLKGIAAGHEGARRLLQMANFEPSFPPHMIELYKKHRFEIPAEPQYWRSQCLAKGLAEEVTDEMKDQWEAMRLAGKARDEHLADFGEPPQRVRIQRRRDLSELRRHPPLGDEYHGEDPAELLDVAFQPLKKDDPKSAKKGGGEKGDEGG